VVEGVVADREKRRGGCSDRASLSGGAAVNCSGETSGEAEVDDGLDEVAVEAVDDE